jgi:hypothetical protein
VGDQVPGSLTARNQTEQAAATATKQITQKDVHATEIPIARIRRARLVALRSQWGTFHAQFLMLGSEPIQVRLLHSRIMVYELTQQGEPTGHWCSLLCEQPQNAVLPSSASHTFLGVGPQQTTRGFALSLCWGLGGIHGLGDMIRP